MNADATPAKPKSAKTQPSFSMDDFMAAIEGQDCTFTPGQVVKGKPHDYLSDGVLVDIGGKSPAFLPLAEAALGSHGSLAEWLPAGVEREFLVAKGPDGDGQVTLSIRLLMLRQSWVLMEEAQEAKRTVSVRVTGSNRGGVTVDAAGLRGFIPRSHLLEREDLDSLVGKRFEAAVLEIDRERKRLVLSQREAAKAGRMAGLTTGQLIEGKVSGLRPFGAFVEFDGVSGLLHVKQISQAHVASIEDVLSVGETIWAIVAEIDEWKGRIALATAPLENYRGEILEHKATVMAEAIARHAQLYAHKAEEQKAREQAAQEQAAQEQAAQAEAIAEPPSQAQTEAPAAPSEPGSEPASEPASAPAIAPKPIAPKPIAPVPAAATAPAETQPTVKTNEGDRPAAPRKPIRLVDLKPKSIDS